MVDEESRGLLNPKITSFDGTSAGGNHTDSAEAGKPTPGEPLTCWSALIRTCDFIFYYPLQVRLSAARNG